MVIVGSAAFQAGQLVGAVILVLIVVGAVRGLVKRQSGRPAAGSAEHPPGPGAPLPRPPAPPPGPPDPQRDDRPSGDATRSQPGS